MDRIHDDVTAVARIRMQKRNPPGDGAETADLRTRPQTRINWTTAGQSRTRLLCCATSVQCCCCRTDLVSLHVHACAQVLCERLESKPRLYRRRPTLEKVCQCRFLPSGTKQSLAHKSNIVRSQVTLQWSGRPMQSRKRGLGLGRIYPRHPLPKCPSSFETR